MNKENFKVLLVDDEMIILSGLKYLIDWTAIGCQLLEPAKNGKEAMDIIKSLGPDIVICDINMPVFSGLEVLQKINDLDLPTVFIMLTNHQDFQMARTALHHRAVDYLVKTNLEPDLLIQAIENAKTEVIRRKSLNKINFVEQVMVANENQLLEASLKTLLSSPNESSKEYNEAFSLCNAKGLFSNFCLLHLIPTNIRIKDLETFSDEERLKINHYQKDIISKLSKNFFPNHLLLEDNSSFDLYIYGIDHYNLELFKRYHTRLNKAFINLIEAEISLMATELFSGFDQVPKLLDQKKNMLNLYFYQKKDFICVNDMNKGRPGPEFDPDSFMQVYNLALLTHNQEEIANLFKGLVQDITAEEFALESLRRFALHLYKQTIHSLMSLDYSKAYEECFNHTDSFLHRLISVTSLEGYQDWLGQLELRLSNYNQMVTKKGDSLVDKAKEYVINNIDSRISLQSVAEHLNISSSYLSTLFKKECNQTFIDYVNHKKIMEACRLLKEQQYLVYEIAFMLGYDNAYYFAKIFKKYMQMTPKEYAQAQTGDQNVS